MSISVICWATLWRVHVSTVHEKRGYIIERVRVGVSCFMFSESELKFWQRGKVRRWSLTLSMILPCACINIHLHWLQTSICFNLQSSTHTVSQRHTSIQWLTQPNTGPHRHTSTHQHTHEHSHEAKHLYRRPLSRITDCLLWLGREISFSWPNCNVNDARVVYKSSCLGWVSCMFTTISGFSLCLAVFSFLSLKNIGHIRTDISAMLLKKCWEQVLCRTREWNERIIHEIARTLAELRKSFLGQQNLEEKTRERFPTRCAARCILWDVFNGGWWNRFIWVDILWMRMWIAEGQSSACVTLGDTPLSIALGTWGQVDSTRVEYFTVCVCLCVCLSFSACVCVEWCCCWIGFSSLITAASFARVLCLFFRPLRLL